MTAATQEQAAPWNDFFHIGPETLAGRYLRSFWQPIFRAEDLPTGRAKPTRILGEDFTVYRGENLSPNPSPTRGGEPTPPSLAGKGAGGLGQPHVVAFRCAHRGTQLSTGWVEGDNLRCFYHGWVYGPDGQCVEQPAEPEPFCQRIRIQSCPVREYLGFIFAYLGEGEPPTFPRFPSFEGEGVLEVEAPTIWPCSYFNRMENSVDEVHIAFVHRDSYYRDGLAAIPQMTAEETEYGIARYGTRPDGTVRVSHFLMPNVLLRTGQPGEEEAGWRDALAWRTPVDDDRHTSFNLYFTHLTGEAADRYRERRRRGAGFDVVEAGNAVLRGDVGIEELGTNLISLQDYVAQVGQGVMLDPSRDHLGQSDAVVALLRRIWARELRALAEGRPTKRWTYPESLDVTTGARLTSARS